MFVFRVLSPTKVAQVIPVIMLHGFVLKMISGGKLDIVYSESLHKRFLANVMMTLFKPLAKMMSYDSLVVVIGILAIFSFMDLVGFEFFKMLMNSSCINGFVLFDIGMILFNF